ncbi:hypothetical protein JQM97_09610 [Prevotella hominis]|uniref:hypothetical protein n=1 Tax=Segatella hominis TaxID=2518605 RepID=UPI001F3439FC|nr:hypothetical protein [Segatella hominis]MCF2591176.1 hypothetical protein [Segatella hominis]
MKMKLFFRISVLVLCILMSLSSFADDKKDRISVEVIDWSKNNQSLEKIVSTSADPKKIYLYATGAKKFVTVGGRYGAQPILAEVGMNFYVEKVAANDDRYYIHSWVHNPTTAHEDGTADYLGVEPVMDTDQRIFSVANDETKKSIYLYVDRGFRNVDDKNENPSPDRIKWYIDPVVGTNNGYKIYSKWKDNQGGYNDNVERNYYLGYYEGPTEEKPQKKFLVVTTDPDRAETFYFIKIDDYLNVIKSQTKKYINVSGLVQDARFERNNKGIDGDLHGDYNDESNNVWQFRYDRSDHAYVYPHLQDNVEELAYMTAWVGSEGSTVKKGNYLIQKITGLKPGLYRVNCQGFYFNPDNIDDKDNTSFVFASQDYKDISNQTALKTIELNDWYMMRDGTYNGSPKDDDLNGFKDISIKHCVNAGKIFAESNPYEDKDVDHRRYDSSVAVLVKADDGSTTGTGTLYIGAGKRANEGGYVFFDNFQLFYMGNKEWYLDATNTSTEEFKITMNGDGSYTPSGINHNPTGENHYEYPVTYNIRRYFNVGKWESLILPCSLTGDQVKQTFGGEKGVQLSAFKEVKGTCVYFKAVDLDKEGIVAGKPYIIKVGKDADIKTKDIEYTFPWGNNTVKVKGPIYQVMGVVPPTFTGDGVTIEDKTSAGDKVQFHGFYYDDPVAAPAGAYVVNNGNMYHLTSAWNSFVGTSWYITITDAKGIPAKLSFSFDGDSSTTAIENVTRQEDAAVQTDGFVYNLSGQRVGTRNNMSNLSSGIYVVAGKKVVVK